MTQRLLLVSNKAVSDIVPAKANSKVKYGAMNVRLLARFLQPGTRRCTRRRRRRRRRRASSSCRARRSASSPRATLWRSSRPPRRRGSRSPPPPRTGPDPTANSANSSSSSPASTKVADSLFLYSGRFQRKFFFRLD